jgi:hypothetical protein
MPSWKKVLISGSDAALNRLIVTNGITGSLFGTASFALTASFLNGGTNGFVQGGNSFGTTAILGTNDNHTLAFETNGSTKMYISSNGDAGLDGSLTVFGTIITTQDILVNGINVGSGNSDTSVLIGSGALQNNTGGSSNVAIGSQAIFTSSNASGLVAIGANTLRLNTVGSANTAVGTNTLQANTTGNNNTAIGREALTSSSIGFNNTANGRSAMFANTSGNNNSAFGAFALANNLSGDGNIAIGVSASLSTTGNNNIVIGFSANTLAAANNNSIVIGSGSVGLGSNTTVIGNSSSTATAIYGDLLLGSTTDNGTDKLQVTGTTKLNGNTTVTGSLNVSGSITGSLFGTASWAVSASWAPAATTAATASFVTASNVYGPYGSNSILSSSFAQTASYSTNLQISGSINNVNYIDFNTGSAEPAWKSGRVYWNNTDGALSVYNAEADISLQVGQENWVRVRNATGVLITNGTAVRLIGSHGDTPKVVLAQSIQVSGSVTRDNQLLGIATHDIEINSFGYITTQGLVKGLNTSAFVDGDRLYVSSSAGMLTKIPPVAPYEIIPAAVVVKASPGGSGILYADPYQPMDFTDLSSVEIGDYSYGDILTYVKSGSVGVWKHTNQLSGSYGLTGSLIVTAGITGSLQGTASYAFTSSNVQGGTANYIPIWNTATSLSSSAIYQSASNVGIGTTSPYSRFTTLGALSTSTSQISIVNSEGGHTILRTGISGISNSGFSLISADVAGTNQNTRLVVSSTGNIGIGTTAPNAKLDVNGNAIITGSLQVSQSIFQYSNNAAILSGSTANIASFNTGSYMAGFFDFVASSNGNARAGTVFTVWNGVSLEYVETSTNDIGSTTNLILSASISGANVLLQGTSLSGSWNVKTLTRMI